MDIGTLDPVDTAKANGPCFVAGTLIHTKEGLVPIEQIKVGDWVLSQPEGKGELSYKQVTQTFVHENASDIYLVLFNYVVEKDGERQSIGADWIAVTWNHPFYTKEKGWKTACNLGYGIEVELVDGNYAMSTHCVPIYQTNVPDVGWAPYDDSYEDMRYGGAPNRVWGWGL